MRQFGQSITKKAAPQKLKNSLFSIGNKIKTKINKQKPDNTLHNIIQYEETEEQEKYFDQLDQEYQEFLQFKQMKREAEMKQIQK